MFSTSISGVLFALLIVQTCITVSALPTSGTTTTITSAQFETRQASNLNRNNNDNNRDNGYNAVLANNTTTSKWVPQEGEF